VIPKSRFLLLAAAMVCTTPAVRAGDDPPLPADLDVVPRDAEMIVSVRVAKLWKSDLFKSYREMLGDNDDAVAAMFGYRPSDLDRVTVAVKGDDLVGILTTIKPTDRKAILKEFAPRAVVVKIGGVTCYRNEERWITLAFPDAHTTIAGPSYSVELHLRHGQAKPAKHTEAMKLAAKHDVVFVATDGESGFPGIEKVVPEAFAAVKPILKAKRGVVVADFDTGDPDLGEAASTLRLKGTFEYADEKATRAATAAVKEGWGLGLAALVKLKETWEKDGASFTDALNGPVLAAIKTLHGMAPVKIDEAAAAKNELVVAAQIRKPRDVGTLALCAAFQTMVRSFASDGSPPKPDPNLEKVARALLACSKDNDGLPPAAISAKDGKTPLLSWRVRILPYLGDEWKQLYGQFKLDEPWDSDHNIRLVMKMPKVFAPTADEEFATATTPFQVFTGPDTLFPGPKPKSLKDVTDGLANTILIAQATRPVPWTKPQDLEYSIDKPVPLIGANTHLCLSGPTAQVAFADGKVRVLHTPLKVCRDPNADVTGWGDGFDHAVLRSLITPAGGEKVDPDTPLQTPNKNPPAIPGGSPPGEFPLTLPKAPLSTGTQPATPAQVAARRKQDAQPNAGAKGPEGVVRAFYENIPSDKNPDKVLELFLSPDTPFTGISGGAGRDVIYTKPAKEMVAIAKKQATSPHVVDSLTVTTLGDSLASVAVQFHTAFVVCKGVFTLTREGGDWRIAACVWESRRPEPAKEPGAVAPVLPAGGVPKAPAPARPSTLPIAPNTPDKQPGRLFGPASDPSVAPTVPLPSSRNIEREDTPPGPRVRRAIPPNEALKPPRLDGTWYLISFEGDGKDVLGGDWNRTLTLDGDKFSLALGGKKYQSGTLTLADGKASPGKADLQVMVDGEIGVTTAAIFEIVADPDGDYLRWCQSYNGTARPTEFETKRGDGLDYSVWRRVQK